MLWYPTLQGKLLQIRLERLRSHRGPTPVGVWAVFGQLPLSKACYGGATTIIRAKYHSGGEGLERLVRRRKYVNVVRLGIRDAWRPVLWQLSHAARI